MQCSGITMFIFCFSLSLSRSMHTSLNMVRIAENGILLLYTVNTKSKPHDKSLSRIPSCFSNAIRIPISIYFVNWSMMMIKKPKIFSFQLSIARFTALFFLSQNVCKLLLWERRYIKRFYTDIRFLEQCHIAVEKKSKHHINMWVWLTDWLRSTTKWNKSF